MMRYFSSKQLSGRVVSDKVNKAIVIVETTEQIPVYGFEACSLTAKAHVKE